MFKWLSGLFDSNDKELKTIWPLVEEINGLEPEFEKLSDEELRAKTDEFKSRIRDGEDLDDILPEAFASVREASKRTIGLRHFDVQMIGGIVLHDGKIAEMKTGEGKTLVATLPLYLNSLTGKGAHLITVNDYLARRDPYWMGPVYNALGVSVASIYPQQDPSEHSPARIYDPDYDTGKENDPWRHFRQIPRKEAYQADIIYGTTSDFGFDYLRDNMVSNLDNCVQRPLNYAIVDEVDNLLIDEARTPLIISAPAEEAAERYQIFARLIPHLRAETDYTIDEKHRSVSLTETGISTVEGLLKREGMLNSSGLYDPENYSLVRYLDSALKAYVLYKKDRNYVVKDGEVIIVDEFTGRMMYGRRYSEGLHQAIEAKERVKIKRESMTYASITIQNYFRMYEKLAGMTGTALTEAEEFYKIYKLDVVVIPTNKPMARVDYDDRIYKDEPSKFRAVVREVEELHKKQQPVLIGTVSIEKSDLLSDMLKRKGIKHQVLNAKKHTEEAAIVARAGEPGAVTVATNMAGRGVDIVLGGNPEGKSEVEWRKIHERVLELGGLFIIGTERHEARRIDNQLRGRSGRQGDPGATRFYVSLEDDVIKRFGGDRIKAVVEWSGLDEDTPIENKLINRSIESAQVRVEGYHFDIRKHLVDYDDVVNQQRTLIYEERRKILSGADLKSNILSMVNEELNGIAAARLGDEGTDIQGALAEINAIIPVPPELNPDALPSLKFEQIEDILEKQAEAVYQQREQEMGEDTMRELERRVLLRTIDSLWIEHLTTMEYRRLEAGWQSLRQVKGVDAYRNMGYEQFQVLMDTIRHDIAHTIFHVALVKKNPSKKLETPMVRAAAGAAAGNTKTKQRVAGKKIGRNDPCPCGSGKKYKHCCGK